MSDFEDKTRTAKQKLLNAQDHLKWAKHKDHPTITEIDSAQDWIAQAIEVLDDD